MNRLCIVLDQHGQISEICADEPLEIYWVDPSVPHDRVYLYQSAKIGPQYVRQLIGGYAVGHIDDGTIAVGEVTSPPFPPSKPSLRIVKDGE